MYEKSHEIPDTHIEILPFEERFFKVPIENLLDELGITLSAPQLYALNALNNNSYEIRFLTGILARRQGKTFLASILAFCKLLEPSKRVTVVAPNYGLSGITFDLVKSFIKRFNIETETMSVKERKIVLTNGSVFTVGSANKPDSLVGVSNNLLLYDEAAIEASLGRVFNLQLRATLDQGDESKLFAYTTPRGKNYVYDWYKRGFDDSYSAWATLRADIYVGGRFFDKDLEEAKLSMSSAEFSQEFLVDFVSVQGLIYNYDPASYIVDENPISEEDWSEIICGIDFGSKDPTGVVHIQVTDDMFYVFADYLIPDKPLAVHAAYLQKLEKSFEVDFTYADSANLQQRQDLSYSYGISTYKSKKDVDFGINFVQSLFESGRLKIHKDCKHVIEALANYHWKENDTGVSKPHHDWSDILDALRYSLYTHSGHINAIVEPLEAEEEVVV